MWSERGTTVKSARMTPNAQIVAEIILHVPSVALHIKGKRLF